MLSLPLGPHRSDDLNSFKLPRMESQRVGNSNMSHSVSTPAPMGSYTSSTTSTSLPFFHDSAATYEKTVQAILCPKRLNALSSSDIPPIPYNRYSFFSYLVSIHGRNFSMLVAPLILLFLWGLGWWIIFDSNWIEIEAMNAFQERMATQNGLVNPLLTPLSFLMTFRMARAAIAWWEARISSGALVGICKRHIAMVSTALMHNRRMKIPSDIESNIRKSGDDEAVELLCEYARWLAVFPVVAKHLIRPVSHPGWEQADKINHLRLEIGRLLSDEEFAAVMKEYDDDNGNPTFDAVSGSRARDAPLVVLNHLHRLAYDVTYLSFPDPDNSTYVPAHLSGRGALFQMISEQINQLYVSCGGMARIQGSHLPFIFAIHLRFFLLVYLFLWNLVSVASYGWLSLPFLFLFNWALLGIEACSVVCENPFLYNPNHMTLGRNAVIVARNIGQALNENKFERQFSFGICCDK